MHSIHDVLLRHRHETARPLLLQLPVDKLQDDMYCEHLTRRLVDAGQEWEVLRATSNTHELIPRGETGIYMFVWRTQFRLIRENLSEAVLAVLYVGKASSDTSDLRSRYRSEYAGLIDSKPDGWWSPDEPSNRESRLSQMLSLADLEYWFLVLSETPAVIESMESELIQLLNPPGNITGRPIKNIRLIKGKPEPAF